MSFKGFDLNLPSIPYDMAMRFLEAPILWYNQGVERKCLVCQTPFRTYPSKIKIGRGKYCSRKCSLTITAIKPKPETQFKKGQKPWNAKGWRYCGRKQQYREIYIGNKKYRREHIIVMEKHLGRSLLPSEEIHHIDGNGLNNNLSNLQLMTKSEHLKLEHKNGRYSAHLDRLHARKR